MSTTDYLLAKTECDVATALRAEVVSAIRETVPRREQFDAIARTPEDARYAAARAALFNAEWAMLESSFVGRPDLLAALPKIMAAPAVRARVVADCLLVGWDALP